MSNISESAKKAAKKLHGSYAATSERGIARVVQTAIDHFHTGNQYVFECPDCEHDPSVDCPTCEGFGDVVAVVLGGAG